MNKKTTSLNTQRRFALWRGLRIAPVAVTLALTFGFMLAPAPSPVFAAGPSVDVCSGAGKCNSFVNKYINPVVVLLTVVVGIAAVISIIMAGIQYTSSADDPGTVSKAKQRIFNTIIGLVAYIFLLAFFNYLVPGGFF
jgi:hypothetical protein